jgi:2-amino-4-hydroxy-6-hydroxymethyldihydropteridine diphosphokinase
VTGEPACFNLPVGERVTVYLGLGTNVGDREQNLAAALERLRKIVDVVQVSGTYETEPVGFADQNDFWNIVVRATSDLPAQQLMDELIGIEKDMGRERSFKNAPRNIDIDLLLYDDVIIDSPSLQVPHPRMHERAFVLRPLLEITPNLADPRTKRPFSELLGCRKFERVVKIT